MEIQRCVGCGIEAKAHPIIGIGQESEELKAYRLPGVATSKRGFVAYGVCRNCHENPETRSRQLKLAFFDKSQLVSALAEAGSNSVTAGGN